MQPFSSDQVRLGFIGVGAMGSRLVRRLLQQEYQVVVYDRDPSRSAELAAYGAVEAASLTQLAEDVDVILSCLTDDDAVRDVYLGPRGLLAGLRSGKVVLEMSTISPETSRNVHAAGAERGISVMDVAIVYWGLLAGLRP